MVLIAISCRLRRWRYGGFNGYAVVIFGGGDNDDDISPSNIPCNRERVTGVDSLTHVSGYLQLLHIYDKLKR